MENKDTGKVTLPALGLVGMVVKDLDKTMEYYSSTFGIGPWRVVDVDNPELIVRGQVYPWRARIASAPLGPVELFGNLSDATPLDEVESPQSLLLVHLDHPFLRQLFPLEHTG